MIAMNESYLRKVNQSFIESIKNNDDVEVSDNYYYAGAEAFCDYILAIIERYDLWEGSTSTFRNESEKLEKAKLA